MVNFFFDPFSLDLLSEVPLLVTVGEEQAECEKNWEDEPCPPILPLGPLVLPLLPLLTPSGFDSFALIAAIVSCSALIGDVFSTKSATNEHFDFVTGRELLRCL